MRLFNIRRMRQTALCVIVLGLAGCGGGGSDATSSQPASTVTGRVIDGYLVGAQVFWDCNDNFRIDEPAEPWVTTSAGGTYSIAPAPVASCVLRAVVSSWTVDESSGQTVGRTYRMSALAGNPAVISPVTTLITDGKYTIDQVRTMTGFSSAADTDYVAKGKDGVKDTNIAGVIAVGLMAVDGLVLSQDTQARGLTYRNLVERMPADSFFVSSNSVIPPSQLLDLLNGLPNWTPTLSSAPAMELGLLDPALTGLCTDKLADGTQVPSSETVCELRKTFVRGALGLAKHHFAISGASIDWSKIPLKERQSLAAAQTIPSNPAVDDLRTDLLAFTAKVNSDIEKARGAFTFAERVQLTSSTVDLTFRALDLGESVFELAPSAKGIRLVSSKFKSVRLPIKLKGQAKAFMKSAGRLKLKDYMTLITAADCARQIGSDLLSTWADAQDDAVDMPHEVVTYLIDTSVCLVELINAPGKSSSDAKLSKKEVFQKVIAATLGGFDFAYGSGAKWSQADQADFWESIDLALSLAITASDTLEVPGLSAALKLVQMYPASMLAVAKGNVAGTKHLDDFVLAMDKATQGLAAYLNDYGRRFFSGRVDPYIGVDVLLDICSKNGESIGRAWSPVSRQSGRAHVLSVQRIQALGEGQTVTLGSAVALAPGQRFFGAGAVNRYTWDFGDGSPPLVTTTPDEVSHTYASTGSYVVTLRTSSAGPAGVDGSEGERYEASVYADVRVDGSPTTSAALFDDFLATSIDSNIWNIVGQPSIAGGYTQYPAFSRINTQGKLTFSGDRIVIEARLAGQGGSRDTSIQLVDTVSGDYIYSGDTSYFGWGFFASGSGDYNFVEVERPLGVGAEPQHSTALGQSTSGFMEYRWTLEGNSITFERGPTLANITQRATRTLGRSIVGRSFYLGIGTASESYSPGTWDWVRAIGSSTAATTGSFSVASNTIPGAVFNVPAGASSCRFDATGTWSAGPQSDPATRNADGVVGGNTLNLINNGVPISTAPIQALVAKRSSTNRFEMVGGSRTLGVTGGEQLSFMMNDATDNGYTNGNTGQLEVSWACR